MPVKKKHAAAELFQAIAEIHSSYDAANIHGKYRSKKKGIWWQGSNSDSHMRIYDLLAIMEGARAIDRNSAFAAQAFDRIVDAVHPGLYELEPLTGDKGISEDLKGRWLEWAEDPDQCDSEARRTFSEIARQTLRHTYVDGDPSLLLLKEGFLQTIEGHRMRGPADVNPMMDLSAHLGIKLDEFGRPETYFFTKTDLGYHGVADWSNIVAYPARSAADPAQRVVLHMQNQRRFSQHRGVSILSPCFDMVDFLDTIEFAELVKQQMSACVTLLEEVQLQKTPAYLPDEGMVQIGERAVEQTPNGQSVITEALAPGARIKSPNKITGFTPNIPGQSFFQHAEHILTFIAINIGLPVQAMLLEPKANFSAWRGAEKKAQEGWKSWQKWLIENLYKEVYQWKVRQWVETDGALNRAANRQRAQPKILKHRWRPNGWAFIQPEVEVKAAALRVATGQSSPSDIHAETNGSGTWADHNVTAMRERGDQILEAIKNVKRIKEEEPEADVTWRDFPIPTAAGVNVSQAYSDSTSESTTDGTTAGTTNKQTAGSKA